LDEIAYKQAAQQMLRKYGQRAQDRARARAEELRVQGDERGVALWTSIYLAIDQLRYCGRLPAVTTRAAGIM
jgi:hypothetical protein